jgi:hypothetical protein
MSFLFSTNTLHNYTKTLWVKVLKRCELDFLLYAFEWITDLSIKIIFDNFTVKIIKIYIISQDYFLKVFPMWHLNFILLTILTLLWLLRD